MLRYFLTVARERNITNAAKTRYISPSRRRVHDKVASWFGSYYERLRVIGVSNLNTNAAMMVLAGLGYALIVEGDSPSQRRSAGSWNAKNAF